MMGCWSFARLGTSSINLETNGETHAVASLLIAMNVGPWSELAFEQITFLWLSEIDRYALSKYVERSLPQPCEARLIMRYAWG